ncbi:hypothetical protein [Aquabacterium sp.]|uniref:hypothetical protein n=1 Tax=Aquabacterium sp. TaxID=1872578 RepID=UPI0025B8EFCF|nr:hypothetical protein [Aquabacterium sp.]
MAIIRILAIVVGNDNTVFYKEDGSTFELSSSDPRLPGLVGIATPVLASGGVAELDFQSVSTTHYRDFEEKTSGVVKLFRVAKKFIKHLISDPHDPENKPEPQTLGTVPIVTNGQPVIDPLHAVVTKDGVTDGPVPATMPAPVPLVPSPKATKLSNAAQEILSKAQPVSDPKFTDDETKEDDTIIAVVEDSTGEQIVIPGIENLKTHMAAALKLGSTIGVENFLRRIAPVIAKRGHSIDDLLRFMSRNDMPIADDGCFVAFKTLNRRGNHQDVYQDIHSGNVIQRVGSKVFMKESMVDPNRRNDCSNGLHVARRAYVGGFRGSSGVMVLIKVAPEDAIAVPQYDSNKMRVCAYHIVGDVPKADHDTVFRNAPLSKDTPTAKLLAAVLAGRHIGVIELVEIGGARGGNLKVTRVGSEAQNSSDLKAALKEADKAMPIIASLDHDKDGAEAAKIDAKEVAAKVADAKAQAQGGKAAQARVLFDGQSWPELLALKKGAKKSWQALGFNATEQAHIETNLTHLKLDKVEAKIAQPVAKPTTTPPASADEQPQTKTPNAKTKAAIKDAEAGKVIKTGTVAGTMTELNDERVVPKMEGSRAEVARQLFTKAAAGDKPSWGHLWLHRKACKKGWDVLGFTPKEIERIKTNKPDWV